MVDSAAPPMRTRTSMVIVALLIALDGCNPTVKVEAPDKPIVINLNVNIQQEVKVKIERDVEQAMQQQPGLFEAPK